MTYQLKITSANFKSIRPKETYPTKDKARHELYEYVRCGVWFALDGIECYVPPAAIQSIMIEEVKE